MSHRPIALVALSMLALAACQAQPGPSQTTPAASAEQVPARSYKYTTNIPPEITSPASVATRLGTLTFKDGVPDEETAQKVYDNLDFQRGVQVFLNAMPAASLGRVMNAFKASPEAQAAWARFDARQGYRPLEVTLGAMRPMIAYPHLRDFANASLRLLSADSQPYQLDPQFDAQGRRIPVPGSAS